MISPVRDWKEFENNSEKIELLRSWKLVSAKATVIKPFYYRGYYTSEPVSCDVIGYVDENEIIICIGEGLTHSIFTEHFRQMQEGLSHIQADLLPVEVDCTVIDNNTSVNCLKDFVAIDVETANTNRHSICSIALVFVENGKIVDSYYTLINPEENFDRRNIGIHGIYPLDVIDAPTFDVFYESIKHRLEHKRLIAHNVSFDGYALRDVLSKYGVTPVNHKFLCTLQIAKKLEKNVQNYKLPSVCEALDIPFENHHHALADATACANIMIELINKHKLEDFKTFTKKTRLKEGSLTKDGFESCVTV
ncbi:MAG: polymerase subunit epsilon [Bacillales bacterium]|jgi:DNA polymerase-3 subunit epsilon|nr:polymerase subunit epsilon [Bacillales bacterium]